MLGSRKYGAFFLLDIITVFLIKYFVTMIECVIIDDEQEAIEDITGYIEKIPNLHLYRSFSSPLDALNFIRTADRPLDLVFLDVDMPLISGIELSKLIREKVKKLIFTTAHSKYALDAFEIDADGFLLKPFSFLKFLSKIEKLFPVHSEQKLIEESKNYIFLKSKEDNLKLIKVNFDEIIAVESLLNYVGVHTSSGKIVTLTSLKEFKDWLVDKPDFLQLHRSFIISTKHIEAIDSNQILLSNGLKIPVGERFRQEFNLFLSKVVFRPRS